ncbi:hypothetical protein LACPH_001770 [Lacticaseibacillus parahuelsenbergensis]|uniref:Uncharacterized protein n=1 Tax=Lacticaseibacillus parahuelsenbergensis TaxID=3068305 RepID=A0ABY9KZV3_9LACO|nr:hypothetical protein [Lacticaseibacillus sp. NCIMB 15471]WLV77051.1 hypothetical protein LACPH_001770 [Lacticaseibacillus sp. NCIMB 15471]
MAEADNEKRIENAVNSHTDADTETVNVRMINAIQHVPIQELHSLQEFGDLYRDED